MADNKLFDIFLYKLLSVCILDNSSDIDKVKDKIYKDIKEILKNLLNNNLCQMYKAYQARDSIKQNILELLILLLSKQECVDFNDEHVFFTDISCFFQNNSINLNNFLDKIDNIENSNYFTLEYLTDIRLKIFKIIFLIECSVIYRNLLTKIEEITNSEFSDHPALLKFINCFIFELTNKENYFNNISNQNERLNFDLVLLYQALNRKNTQAISPSNISFVKRLITRPPKSTLDGKLFKFKQDYKNKTGKAFPWQVLSTGQVSVGKQVHGLPKEIAVYFSTREINRSPKAVKKAFKMALRNV